MQALKFLSVYSCLASSNCCRLLAYNQPRKIILCLLTVLFVFLGEITFAQGTVIKGSVIDDSGKPIKGVTISFEGSKRSSITNENGFFEVSAGLPATLTFSHPDFNILKKDIKENEVVQVMLFSRYFKKTKLFETITRSATNDTINLISRDPSQNTIQSEGSVGTNQLITTPSAQFTTALQGRIAGLNLSANSGAPGADGIGMSFNVRGGGYTFLIDGVERGYTSIDPEQIESVTIYRDALSTVLMGMRSSNAILSVKTKRGTSGSPRMSFTVQSGIRQPTALPKPLSAAQYATLYNEAQQNDAGTALVTTPVYSQDDINLFQNGTDPYRHPDVDWYNTVLKKSSSLTRYNFNVQGNGSGFRYFVDMDYLNDDGLFKTLDSNRYNTNALLSRYGIRSNVGVDITKTTFMQLNLYGRFQRNNQSGAGSATVLNSLLNTPQGAYPVFNPNGSLGGTSTYGGNTNVYGQSVSRGYQYNDVRDIAVDLDVKQRLDFLTPNLYFNVQGSYNNSSSYTSTRLKDFAVYSYNPLTSAYTKFGNTSEQTTGGTPGNRYRVTFLQATLGYNKIVGKHELNALLLAKQQNTQLYTSNYLPELYTDYGGRVTYNYDGKYLAEFAGTRSGYNWFAPSKRWANYWAAGLGWNIHKENFIKDNLPVISNLKLRGDYGLTGRANTGYYSYIQTYWTWESNANAADAYNWGQAGTLERSSGQNALANPELGPEKAKKLNIGFDIGLWKNKLTLTAEYFDNNFFDMVGTSEYRSAILGTSYPAENILKSRYWGNEFTLGYENNVNNFNYFINGNFSRIQSELIYSGELPKLYPWMARNGQPVNIAYGYVADGLFKSYEEINSTTAVLGVAPKSTLRPGDIKYKDLNNDGVIDTYDQAAIGNGKPTMYYGLTLGFNYKGLDFSALIQGTVNRESYLSPTGNFFNAFGNGGAGNAFEYNLDRFTPATAQTATQPRVWLGSNVNNQQNSSYWMRKSDYLRLKNVEIGYTLPNRLTKKIGLPAVRTFVNGLNLLTFWNLSDLRDDYDPEAFGNAYPILRVVNFGINIKL